MTHRHKNTCMATMGSIISFSIVVTLLSLSSILALLAPPVSFRHGYGIATRNPIGFIDHSIPSPSTLMAVSDVVRIANINSDDNDESESGGLFDIETLLSSNDEHKDDPSACPRGLIDGFFIVQQYCTPPDTFNISSPILDGIDKERVALSAKNVTLPIALMLLDGEEYPTLSKARKACRKKNIVLHRKSCKNGSDEETNMNETNVYPVSSFKRPWSTIGRAHDRVYPGDVIGKQVRLSHGSYSRFIGLVPPPFDLPVVYEDDHIAIVNKPAGVAVYDDREGMNGRNTIKYALPHVLQPPPKVDGSGGLRRPITCHRLDKPTSGLLVVGKTYDAVVDITRQFEERIVCKTYTAIVNGRLPTTSMDDEGTISSRDAYKMGVVDIDPSDDDTDIRWHVAQDIQEGKEALTVWRSLRCCKSMKAKDQCVTLVELKPKSGRKHQLRRHMAWNYNCPIVGDTTYGTIYDAKRWGRGLMLCSNRIEFRHPYYNTLEGRKIWERLNKEAPGSLSPLLRMKEDGAIVVQASIDVPNKFLTFLATEEKRAAMNSL